MPPAFDHRASIVKYLDNRADLVEAQGRRSEATALRVEAGNVAAQLDIAAGRDGVAGPVEMIIRATAAALGGVSYAEVIDKSKGMVAARRVRFAAMWVAKKRLGWSHERLAPGFHREQSTVSHGIDRAKDLRATDEDFKRITDRLCQQDIVCEHCQNPLVPVALTM